MGKRNFNFIEDEDADDVPRNYWMVRMVICGFIAGCAASAYILINYTKV